MAGTTKATSKTTSKTSATKNKNNGEHSKFHDLFMDELKDIYWAEKNLVKSLPKMQKAATSEELASAIAEHVEVTKGHVSRLEQVFEMLGAKATARNAWLWKV